MGLAVTTGKAWHAHAMHTCLYCHDSSKIFAPCLGNGQATWSFGAPALAAWVSPGVGPQAYPMEVQPSVAPTQAVHSRAAAADKHHTQVTAGMSWRKEGTQIFG
jgi:hypothetical protein